MAIQSKTLAAVVADAERRGCTDVRCWIGEFEVGLDRGKRGVLHLKFDVVWKGKLVQNEMHLEGLNTLPGVAAMMIRALNRVTGDVPRPEKKAKPRGGRP